MKTSRRWRIFLHHILIGLFYTPPLLCLPRRFFTGVSSIPSLHFFDHSPSFVFSLRRVTSTVSLLKNIWAFLVPLPHLVLLLGVEAVSGVRCINNFDSLDLLNSAHPPQFRFLVILTTKRFSTVVSNSSLPQLCNKRPTIRSPPPSSFTSSSSDMSKSPWGNKTNTTTITIHYVVQS